MDVTDINPTAKSPKNPNAALFGGLVFLAVFFLAVVIVILILFFCYCRKAKGERYKYNQHSVQQHQARTTQRDHNDRGHVRDPTENFITSHNHSTDGSTTAMLSVHHLQRILMHADDRDTPDCRQPGRYDVSYDNHFKSKALPPSTHVSVPQTRRLDPDERKEPPPATLVVNKETGQYEYPAKKRERHLRGGSDLEQARPGHGQCTPPEIRALPPVPDQLTEDGIDQRRAHQVTTSGESLGSCADNTDSAGSEGHQRGMFQKTWADNNGPQFHERREQLENDLICDSNIVYESTDVCSESVAEGGQSNNQGHENISKAEPQDRYNTKDFHNTEEGSRLPEVEALNELDRAVEGHLDPVLPQGVRTLPPMKPNRLPPLEGAKLPALDGARRQTRAPAGDLVGGSASGERQSRRYSLTEATPFVRGDKRRSISSVRHDDATSSDLTDANTSSDMSEHLDRTTGYHRRSYSLSRLAEKTAGNVPSSPAPQRRGRSRERSSASERKTSNEPKQQHDNLGNTANDGEMASSGNGVRDGREVPEPGQNSGHRRHSSRTRGDPERKRESSRTRADPERRRDCSKTRRDSERPRDSSRTRAESENRRESSRKRPDSGRRRDSELTDEPSQPVTDPEHTRQSNRKKSASPHKRDSSQTRVESDRKADSRTKRPDSGRTSDSGGTRADSERTSDSSGARSDSERTDDGSSTTNNNNQPKYGVNENGDSSGQDQHTRARTKNSPHHRHHRDHHHRRDENDDQEAKTRRHRQHGRDRHHGNRHKHRSKDDQIDDLAMTLHAEDELYQFHKKASPASVLIKGQEEFTV